MVSVFKACVMNDIEVLKKCIAEGSDLEAKGELRKTGFIYACAYGYTEIVKLLIEVEVNLEAKSIHGYTGFIMHVNMAMLKL